MCNASALWGWAKTNRRSPDDPAFAWLSLVDHGRDVAAVFDALMGGPFQRGLRHVFDRNDKALIDALTGGVGLHDLGKASWTFQGRANGPTPLARLFPFEHHADEACALLLDEHRQNLPGWKESLLPIADIDDAADRALLRAVFSHHGRPRTGTGLAQLRDLPDRFRPLLGDGRDPLDLARALVAALPAREVPSPLAKLTPEQRRFACHWLMGIINLADWLGSNDEWFKLRPERDEPFDRAIAVAEALRATGLDGEAPLELS